MKIGSKIKMQDAHHINVFEGYFLRTCHNNIVYDVEEMYHDKTPNMGIDMKAVWDQLQIKYENWKIT